MNTQTIRTTVDLDRDLYIAVKQKIASERETLRDAVRRAMTWYASTPQTKTARSFERAWTRMRAIARKGRQIDLTKWLIRERDRRYHDDARLG